MEIYLESVDHHYGGEFFLLAKFYRSLSMLIDMLRNRRRVFDAVLVHRVTNFGVRV